jgi:hypothetical protein
MGRTRGEYIAEFPEGSQVWIADPEHPEEFKSTWKYHHPLTDQQIGYASCIARVKSVTFYHGGDELYAIEGIPGIWHESGLSAFAQTYLTIG